MDLRLDLQTITNNLALELQPQAMTFDGGFQVVNETKGRTYAGAYEVEPTDAPVVLNTKDLNMAHNVVVKPIPSNYGRISWDGSKITIT